MFSTKFKFKIQYFDRSIIRTNWSKINKRPLQKAGTMVMRIARGSIKRRVKKRGKPSKPGSPPYSRRPGSTPPFKQIFSVPFRAGTSVIVGMVGYGGPNPAPGLMEQQEGDGTAMRRVFLPVAGPRRRFKNGRLSKRRTKSVMMRVKYPARPFMRPALFKARSVLPAMWLNSLK